MVNIGPAGALVETGGRLLPGTCVDVHVITVDGRELVRSRVGRAFVSGVWPERIAYRGALAFDRLVVLPPGEDVASSSATSLPDAVSGR